MTRVIYFQIGDEYFLFITKCKNPKACTVLLRGSSKDILNEVERNMRDALNVVRNLYLDPRVVPGGGAIEMMLRKVKYIKIFLLYLIIYIILFFVLIYL